MKALANPQGRHTPALKIPVPRPIKTKEREDE